MQGLDKQTFVEIIIHPSGFLEQFADFITEYFSPDSEALTSCDIAPDMGACAIEYLDTSSHNPFLITYDDDTWHGTLDFSPTKARACGQSEQLIIRLDKDFFHACEKGGVSSLGQTHLDTQAFSESSQTSSLKSPFINALHSFVALLSERVGKHIDFCYHIEEKQNHDWIEAYKQSIQPVVCGRFYIRASWHTPLTQLDTEAFEAISESSLLNSKLEELDSEIIIDPALAFGSGHHASTSMCLELLSSLDLEGKNVLDVGCGSGILGIGAAKLGARVYACDTDELAIEECAKNAANNHITLAHLWQGSIQDSPQNAPQSYDVIVANIIAFVVKLLHNDFKAKLSKNSVLILSGILSEYKSDIMNAFSDFELLESRQKDGWIALALKLK